MSNLVKAVGAGLFILASTAACTTNGVHDPQDPLKPWNKAMTKFNTGADNLVIAPTARGYRAVVPKPGRDGVRNILNNLRSPVILGNDVLQAKPGRAGETIARFGINSTLGILGLFDVAKRLGIKRHDEDMGQTLATWGITPGPYLVLPFLGPTNFRDLTGTVLDVGFDPLTYMRFKGRQAIQIGRYGVSGLSAREASLDSIEALKAGSIDDYTSIRSAYKQLRDNAIADGKVDVDALPDIDDEGFDDDYQE